MSLWMIFIVAVSLSMDAFSLALVYGTLSFSSKIVNMISLTVGIFHFLMPFFGFLCGRLLLFFLEFQANFLIGIIFVVLSIEMLLSVFKRDNIEVLSGFLSYILFGFTVSVDSFSVGIGMGSLGGLIIVPCIVFSVVSFLFTYMGLKLGKRLASRFGLCSTVLGSIILFLLGIFYIF